MKRAFWLLLCGVALADGHSRPTGWSEGTPAANAGQVLVPKRQSVALPDWMVERIQGPTFVYYFNPECGHCQATIPGVVALADELEGELDFLAVANSGATPESMKWFMDTFHVDFPIILDQPRGFGFSVGASSTPTVLVFEPDGQGGVVATDAYYPWFDGAELLVKIRRNPADPWSAFKPDHYVGNTACSSCHLVEAQSWQLSHHAIAYRTLYLANEAENPECVGCHVTGLGEPSGMVLGDHGHAMTDVGCEACHSAGGPHDGRAVEATEQCATCHNEEHSIAFSVEKGLPHIDHYVANTLSARERDKRYRELASGQAPKPLLAFPEGTHVGAEPCAECHAEVVDHWQSSPHAQAMGSLKRKEAQDPECVACHATGAASGPPSERIEDYRVDQGVACESCHGPAGEHLKDPRAGTIEGLGDDCPVCVLEAVCTQCHDAGNDPGWDLDTRLESFGAHGVSAAE